ncbi:MAG: glycosyltransferase [Chloroflexota bacterium]|nr:glycosyltransferase [Chloroflexota bacterium]MDQ5865975.1 glycosyltransferase [Chloroflexota bacterium]
MKLALVIPGFQASDTDWCIPAFTNLARELSLRNEVHVFALRYPHRRGDYSIGAVRVHALGGGQLLGRRILGASLAKLWADTLRSLAREHTTAPFDVILGIWATESGWLATQTARTLGVPSLVHLAGGELVYLPSIRYGYLGRGVDGVLLNHTLALADRLTLPSRHMLNLHASEFPDTSQKAVRWSLGVDTTMFRAAKMGNGSGRPFTFVSVASFIPVKNHAWLIRSFADLRHRRPDLDIRLALVGEGPLEPHMRHLTRQLHLEGYVTFHGSVPHHELVEVYGNSSAFLVGSWHEAQCMAVLEAMSCGLPWIGPPVGALSDVGSDQEPPGATSGVVVTERSIYAMSRAMERLASLSTGEYDVWSANAAALVRRDYDLATQTARLERLLARLTQLYRG